MTNLKIFWTAQAKLALKAIYIFYKKQSLQGAKNVKSDLLRAPKTVHFAKQYQVDDINPKYRRIVVRDFKLLYLVRNNKLYVLDIVSTKQSPEILKNK